MDQENDLLIMRKHWAITNQDNLYKIYFTPLLTQSTLDYSELINYEELYSQYVVDNILL